MRADLALVGFGNVGRRFAHLLEERRGQLADDCDLGCRVVGIATGRHGAVFNPSGLDAISAAVTVASNGALSGAPSEDGSEAVDGSTALIERLQHSPAPLRVVVETTTLNIKDGRPALDHVETALRAGLHVVTANKGPAAFAYERLRDMAATAGVSFLFEGAVMDGVPIFNLVRETMPGVRVTGFRGVINTTTNHILTAVENGEAFAAALARMQAEGIAEADPSLDLDGWDAAAKAAALANVLLGARITPHDVARTGIDASTADAARTAKDRGRRLKLVVSARSGQRPSVRPQELPADDLLARLGAMENALILETDLLGDVAIGQLTGNLTVTAYALLSDLITIRRRCAARHEAPLRRSL
jgi:homoserine dehydrogenase